MGEGTLESVPLANGARLTVGRDPDCTVTLDHPSISRHHAAFHGGPPVAIEDLGSRNGIRIDGRRLTPRELVALELGVSIQLGPYVAVVMGGARSSISAGPRFDAIPISDPTEAGLPEIARRIARAGISALLLGETGTGKEVLARTLHQLSRRTGQLVAVNCAALSEQLLESELFGHERGAFTGATSAKPGLFEVARGGTVFLDEVGELPPALQAKLLRALDSRETYRLGGTEPIRLDVRFLSATHRDLVADVAAGRFRRDFYFRINGITLTIAPLRARSGGIPALASHLLSEAAQHAGATPPRLTASAIAALVRHDWPGNVRELKTVLERAVVLADGAEIEAAHILLDRMSGEPREPRSEAAGVTKTSLELAASAHRGNVTSIARELGTSQSQVRRLAKRHGVDLASFR
ncbi:MAG: sigma 54-interacting transcriptional regulator [Kofleriaceae bacterium]